jgi:sigma-70-like protein
VRRLPEQQRSALLMRELEGLSYAELAEANAVSVPAVKSLLVRARLGLVQAAEARDTTCTEIRADLALAHGRGVRANGRSRRHLRDCNGCREYRQGLRRVQRSFGALAPAGGAGLLAKLGLGGSGSAAAGGGAAGGTGLIGGSAATLTAGKVCAVVCSVALTAGGAVEVQHEISDTGAQSSGAPAPQVRSLPETPPPRPADAGVTPRSGVAAPAKPAAKVKAPTARTAPSAQETPVTIEPDPAAAPAQQQSISDAASAGGAQAPADLADEAPTTDSSAPKATGAGGDQTTPPILPLANGEKPASGGGSGSPPHP